MSFVYVANQDLPDGLYALDTAPPVDLSGNGGEGVISGTPGEHIPVAPGCRYAPVLGAATISFESQVFRQGYEQQAFTLEAWVRVISPDETQQILGHGSDGLSIEGTVVRFIINYESADPAEVSWDLQTNQRVHVVGVYTSNKISLYINGLLVTEKTLTAEQQADAFDIDNSDELSSGATAGDQRLAINGIAFYNHPVPAERIQYHYEESNIYPVIEEITTAHLGNRVPVSLESADVFLDQWWRTKEDWNLATINNVTIDDDFLVPQFQGTTSVEGAWIDAFVLSAANDTSIYGVVLNWDGEGAVVEVSLDGDNWEQVTRGIKVDTIPEGFNPTDEQMLVRVTFPGGIEDDESYLDNLNIVGIRNATGPQVTGKILTYSDASPAREHPHMDLNDNWGVRVDGSLEIVDDSDLPPARTLELWIKRDGANPTVNVSGTTYQNGEPASTTLPDGQWTLLHIVSATDIVDFIITGPAQIGSVALYPDLDAAGIYKISDDYFARNPLVATPSSTLSIEENTNSVDIYGFEWAIQSAG